MGTPLPSSPKIDMKSWDANLDSGVEFGGGECEVGMNIEWRPLEVFYLESPSTNGVTNSRMEDGRICLFVNIRGWLLSSRASSIIFST